MVKKWKKNDNNKNQMKVCPAEILPNWLFAFGLVFLFLVYSLA